MSDAHRILDRAYTMMWREGRIEEALVGLDEDFEWVVPDIPEGSLRRGPEGVREFFREWLEPWDDVEVDWELKEVGQDTVLAIIRTKGRGRASGVPVEVRFGQLWTFRDGRAKRMVLYTDIDEAHRHAGLQPPSST